MKDAKERLPRRGPQDGLLGRAQGLFLDGALREAAAGCLEALRAAPSAGAFGLLAACHEGLGYAATAGDCRLLQALLAGDAALWGRLLGEALRAGLHHRAALCLQRLAALTPAADAATRRGLCLQRADIYAGLGELTRAAGLYRHLWRTSGHGDFEVLAILAALLFQVGKLQTLDNILTDALHALNTAPPDHAEWCKRYLTLINIRMELLLERGRFLDVCHVVDEVSSKLHIHWNQLHLDILLKFATANAYLGKHYVVESIFINIISYSSQMRK